MDIKFKNTTGKQSDKPRGKGMVKTGNNPKHQADRSIQVWTKQSPVKQAKFKIQLYIEGKAVMMAKIQTQFHNNNEHTLTLLIKHSKQRNLNWARDNNR